ncbi:ABC transporter permease subunit [Desulfurococcus amylolyticus]|uniref:Binding-protein-dependent transport systems inner membrane component n=1 Tax=Desulfurococcus amylolyticus DSM 16532 TaxID=768672 RepID=I3XQP2_DESAM|nr:ABC transporter permease subunit [Desulfurococcus amylolyticus]AFL66266.1 binding-protein-dependent transport systems inner membrane component [Desulfurococcus amylolyticus DSM 16532]
MVSVSLTILKITLTIIGVFIAVAIAYPLIYIVAQALIGKPTIIVSSFQQLLSYGVTFDNFIKTLQDPEFHTALRNSLIVASITVILAILVIIPSGYAFSRFEFLGKNTLLYYYLIVSQAGGGLGIIAVLAMYIFFLRLTAYGINIIQIWVLPLVYVSGLTPFQTWLIKSYFDQLPKELDEASFIDGADWFTIIFRVVLPASKAAFIIITIFAFMNAWGEFIIANILGLDTLGRYIYSKAVAGQAGTMRPGEFAAAALLYAIPMIILFTLSQKYIGEAYRLGMKG